MSDDHRALRERMRVWYRGLPADSRHVELSMLAGSSYELATDTDIKRADESHAQNLREMRLAFARLSDDQIQTFADFLSVVNNVPITGVCAAIGTYHRACYAEDAGSRNRPEPKAWLIEQRAYARDALKQNVQPHFANRSVGELWAMSGKFLARDMPEEARLIAAYARAAERAEAHNRPRPDPDLFRRGFDAEQLQQRIESAEDRAEIPF